MLCDIKVGSITRPDAGNATARYCIYEGEDATETETLVDSREAVTRYRRSKAIRRGMFFPDVSLLDDHLEEMLQHILHRHAPHKVITEQKRTRTRLPVRLERAIALDNGS